MPFYEYQCTSCGHDLEVLQKISDAPLRKCPECGKNALQKLVSAPVFRLKGSGWYETDFKSDKEAKRNLANDADPAVKSEPAKSDTTADAKPAAKADPKPAAEKPSKSAAKPTKKAAPKPAKKAPAKKKR